MNTGTDNRRKLRMAMIGGGRGSFIGDIHRKGAALCGDIDLVAGAFSSDPAVARASGAELHVPTGRSYDEYPQMLVEEARRPVGERPDFVVIVTPNHLHFDAAHKSLAAGFNVVCDKPLTRTLAEAVDLSRLAKQAGRAFGVTYAYLGYPLVSQARRMIADGELGEIRKVYVDYPQGWLSGKEESSGNRQACWRTDPARSGHSGCIGDIGTHAHALAEFVTGEEVVEVCADLHTFVDGRRLDDDGSALLRFSNGVRGVLSASQVCAGAENGLRIAVYGSSGGLEWHQESPNSLIVRRSGQPITVFRAGADMSCLYPEVREMFLTPSGHPEGFIEAFANLYRAYAAQLRRRPGDIPELRGTFSCPDVDTGVRGMAFIEAMVRSSAQGGLWTPLQCRQGAKSNMDALAAGESAGACA